MQGRLHLGLQLLQATAQSSSLSASGRLSSRAAATGGPRNRGGGECARMGTIRGV
jgi:hypothetical protein